MKVVIQKNMGGSQGGMPAQVDFDCRGEPAQRHGLIGSRDHKGGLGEIILGRHRREHMIWQPFIEDDHCGRVAGEQPAGESVDLE